MLCWTRSEKLFLCRDVDSICEEKDLRWYGCAILGSSVHAKAWRAEDLGRYIADDLFLFFRVERLGIDFPSREV